MDFAGFNGLSMDALVAALRNYQGGQQAAPRPQFPVGQEWRAGPAMGAPAMAGGGNEAWRRGPAMGAPAMSGGGNEAWRQIKPPVQAAPIQSAPAPVAVPRPKVRQPRDRGGR